LDRSISCALSQTYPEVEVIVVDDGSTDDTAQRVARFGDRITYIRKENTGRGDNRNQALIRSSGKYIQFLDADDTIDAEKLATQIPYLEADETVACIYSDCSCKRLGRR
jgi:glycosyltransferase involved in cell wall biosynthesis